MYIYVKAEYIEYMSEKADLLTITWTPANQWHRIYTYIHGDGNATTDGEYHMESIATRRRKRRKRQTEHIEMFRMETSLASAGGVKGQAHI